MHTFDFYKGAKEEEKNIIYGFLEEPKIYFD
jgi:hypothetical protein